MDGLGKKGIYVKYDWSHFKFIVMNYISISSNLKNLSGIWEK